MKIRIFAAAAILVLALCACNKRATAPTDDFAPDAALSEEPASSDNTDDAAVYPATPEGEVVNISAPTALSDEENEKVTAFLYEQLGGDKPEEQSFSFTFPIEGRVTMNGREFYRGSWEMAVFDELGEEVSSSVIMDFLLAVDFSEMCEVFDQDGVVTLYHRDILH